MTTYTAIANSEIDQDSPITQPLMTALRDNPIAIAENDSSVPAALRSWIFLGSAALSGTVTTISGLDLTPYTQLMVYVGGASTTAYTATDLYLRLNGYRISTSLTGGGSGTDSAYCWAVIDIGASGFMTAWGVPQPATGATATTFVSTSGIVYTATSLNISYANGGSGSVPSAFDGGTFFIYARK